MGSMILDAILMPVHSKEYATGRMAVQKWNRIYFRILQYNFESIKNNKSDPSSQMAKRWIRVSMCRSRSLFIVSTVIWLVRFPRSVILDTILSSDIIYKMANDNLEELKFNKTYSRFLEQVLGTT